MKQLITMGRAAKRLDCSERTVRRLVEDGEIVACKLRGQIRIDSEYLNLYVNKKILEFMEESGMPDYFLTDHDKP